MKTFYLKNGNEIIKKVKSDSIVSAISYFSKIKRLNKKDLLKIFNITH
jgi:hypothetical protein